MWSVRTSQRWTSATLMAGHAVPDWPSGAEFHSSQEKKTRNTQKKSKIHKWSRRLIKGQTVRRKDPIKASASCGLTNAVEGQHSASTPHLKNQRHRKRGGNMSQNGAREDSSTLHSASDVSLSRDWLEWLHGYRELAHHRRTVRSSRTTARDWISFSLVTVNCTDY